jgi:hypothetical protein
MDSLGLKAGPNLYAYVLNNPMTHFDLYGLDAIEVDRMNQLNGYSESENATLEYRTSDKNSHSYDSVDSTRPTQVAYAFPFSIHNYEMNSQSYKSSWTTIKESLPGFFENAFEAMDKYSYSAMLAPHPYVRAGAVGLKALGACGKTLLKILRRPSKTVVKHIVHENFLTKQVASTTNALVQKELCITSEYVNLANQSSTKHILYGDATGGRHRPGIGLSGKTEFPVGWSDDKIMHEISDIATAPHSITRLGRNGRIIGEGTRDGIDIRVIQQPDGNIVTGFPINMPRNP